MKERERIPYRNILVCWDKYRQVGWKTKEEFEEMPVDQINWHEIVGRGGKRASFHKNETKHD